MKRRTRYLVLLLCAGLVGWLVTRTNSQVPRAGALPSPTGDGASDSMAIPDAPARQAQAAPTEDDSEGEPVTVAPLMQTMYAELAAALTASAPGCDEMATGLQDVIDERAFELKEVLRHAQQQPGHERAVSDAARAATERHIGSFYAVLKPHLAVCSAQLMPVLKGLTAIEHEE